MIIAVICPPFRKAVDRVYSRHRFCRTQFKWVRDKHNNEYYRPVILFYYAATYITYVQLLPSLVFGVMIGAWIDRFNRGRKWLLIMFCVAGLVENLILILLTVKFDTSKHSEQTFWRSEHKNISWLPHNIPAPYINVFTTIPTLLLTGGSVGPRIAITHYLTATTPPKFMAIRFMFFEISVMSGDAFDILLNFCF